MRERPSWTAVTLLFVVLVVGLSSLAIAPAARPVSAPGRSAPVTSATTPASAGLTASPNPDDSGVSATFNASGACLALVGTCNYSYTGLPSGCTGSSGESFSCTPSSTGQFDVNVTASWACPVCVSNSASITFTVNSYPTISSVTASPSNLDVGQTTSLNVTVTGGSAPFDYSWSNLPSGCSAMDTSVLACQPGGNGTFEVDVGIRDAVGGRSSGSVSFSVAPQLVVQLALTPAVRDLGGSVTLTASVSGGQSPYSELYSDLPAGCSTADTTTLTCTPTALGTFQVTVTARDSVASRASAVASLDVVALPNVTLTVTPSTVDLGHGVTFVASLLGGSGSDQYSYANLPGGCASANQSTLSCTPTATGSFSVVVSVSDSDGNTATATAVVTINPALAATIDANVTSGLTPLAVSFGANLSGGTAPFQYSWRFAPNASSNLTNPRFVFFTAGNYSVSLTITDALGSTVTTSAAIRVVPTSNLLTYTISFFVNPSGCGPITLDSFLLRDGSTEALPAATYPAIAPSCPGFAFTQWVPSGSLVVRSPASASTDVTVNGAGSITAVLTVVATHGSPPTGGFSIHSLSSWAPYVPLLLGAVLALYVMKHYLDSRRAERKPTGGDGRPPPPPPPGQTGPVATAGASPTAVPAGRTGATAGGAGATASSSLGRSPSASPPPPPPHGIRPADRPVPAVRADRPAPPSSGVPPTARPPPVYSSPYATPPPLSGSPPAPVRSPIAPPSARSVPSTAAANAPAPRALEPTPPAASRSWPPSRIWDISPTPNTPKKSDPRRMPPEGT